MVNANSGWLFSSDQLKNTPSIKDGMSLKEEQEKRREGCQILRKVGYELKLSENPTLSSACTFFHRFYMIHSFNTHPLEISALGCLFLAGKVEETPKKCKDIVAVACKLLPERFNLKTLLNDVFMFERTLLATLGFDLYLENPYTSLLNYAKIFKEEREAMKEIVQFAWTFLNDCAGTTLCLQYEPEIIAVSILELSLKFHNKPVDEIDWDGKKQGVKWHEQFIDGLTQGIIEDVCHVALDFYEKNAKIAAEQEKDNEKP
uniref:Cyclin-like domain-containing protein n=1 Tax=Panagrolaimus sp. JU765 TaxID=591449 RepID=A0AC34QZE1_9BILA